MAEKVRIIKTVQQKDDFSKVVSKKFTTFIPDVAEEDADTVQELFRLYDKLYLEIPLEGPQSHTYLVEESSKLVDLQQDNTAIQPLLDEISELRARLLLANEQIFELEQQNNV